MWAGTADPLIFPQGAQEYYQRVEATMGVRKTEFFAKFYWAPGAGHLRAASILDLLWSVREYGRVRAVGMAWITCLRVRG